MTTKQKKHGKRNPELENLNLAKKREEDEERKRKKEKDDNEKKSTKQKSDHPQSDSQREAPPKLYGKDFSKGNEGTSIAESNLAKNAKPMLQNKNETLTIQDLHQYFRNAIDMKDELLLVERGIILKANEGDIFVLRAGRNFNSLITMLNADSKNRQIGDLIPHVQNKPILVSKVFETVDESGKTLKKLIYYCQDYSMVLVHFVENETSGDSLPMQSPFEKGSLQSAVKNISKTTERLESQNSFDSLLAKDKNKELSHEEFQKYIRLAIEKKEELPFVERGIIFDANPGQLFALRVNSNTEAYITIQQRLNIDSYNWKIAETTTISKFQPSFVLKRWNNINKKNKVNSSFKKMFCLCAAEEIILVHYYGNKKKAEKDDSQKAAPTDKNIDKKSLSLQICEKKKLEEVMQVVPCKLQVEVEKRKGNNVNEEMPPIKTLAEIEEDTEEGISSLKTLADIEEDTEEGISVLKTLADIEEDTEEGIGEKELSQSVVRFTRTLAKDKNVKLNADEISIFLEIAKKEKENLSLVYSGIIFDANPGEIIALKTEKEEYPMLMKKLNCDSYNWKQDPKGNSNNEIAQIPYVIKKWINVSNGEVNADFSKYIYISVKECLLLVHFVGCKSNAVKNPSHTPHSAEASKPPSEIVEAKANAKITDMALKRTEMKKDWESTDKAGIQIEDKGISVLKTLADIEEDTEEGIGEKELSQSVVRFTRTLAKDKNVKLNADEISIFLEIAKKEKENLSLVYSGIIFDANPGEIIALKTEKEEYPMLMKKLNCDSYNWKQDPKGNSNNEIAQIPYVIKKWINVSNGEVNADFSKYIYISVKECLLLVHFVGCKSNAVKNPSHTPHSAEASKPPSEIVEAKANAKITDMALKRTEMKKDWESTDKAGIQIEDKQEQQNIAELENELALHVNHLVNLRIDLETQKVNIKLVDFHSHPKSKAADKIENTFTQIHQTEERIDHLKMKIQERSELFREPDSIKKDATQAKIISKSAENHQEMDKNAAFTSGKDKCPEDQHSPDEWPDINLSSQVIRDCIDLDAKREISELEKKIEKLYDAQKDDKAQTDDELNLYNDFLSSQNAGKLSHSISIIQLEYKLRKLKEKHRYAVENEGVDDSVESASRLSLRLEDSDLEKTTDNMEEVKSPEIQENKVTEMGPPSTVLKKPLPKAQFRFARTFDTPSTERLKAAYQESTDAMSSEDSQDESFTNKFLPTKFNVKSNLKLKENQDTRDKKKTSQILTRQKSLPSSKIFEKAESSKLITTQSQQVLFKCPFNLTVKFQKASYYYILHYFWYKIQVGLFCTFKWL